MNKITLNSDLETLVDEGRKKINQRVAADRRRREEKENQNRRAWARLLERARGLFPDQVKQHVVIYGAGPEIIGLMAFPSTPPSQEYEGLLPCAIILPGNLKPIRFAVQNGAGRSFPRVQKNEYAVGDTLFHSVEEAIAFVLEGLDVEFVDPSEPA